VDLVFTPLPAVIYPPGFATRIDLGAITKVLEGAARPDHFSGVATVVAKLFNIFQPDRAYFGQKDGQQCVVMRQLVRDLDIPVEIVVCDTVREPDGLAMSSRNVYLTPSQRAIAPILFKVLSEAHRMFQLGEREGGVIRAAMRAVFETEPQAELDYVSVADCQTLAECSIIDTTALVSAAVRIGSTRLIDCLVLSEGPILG
jgi:pantoate--beta-alanine ligase